MRLQVLVNHYQEPKEIVKRFLDSLATQENVEFETLICSDGGVMLEKDGLTGYPFPIIYAYKEHTGVCNTRNVLMDKATAEYIMFCDIDDEFSKPDGLSSLLAAADDMDLVGSPFSGEVETNGEFKYHTLNNDTLHVHGKIFRRQYLIDNNIRYPDDMEISGDMAFLWMAFAFTNKIKWIDNNFIIWKHNPKSVTRNTKFHNIHTFDKTLECYLHVADELIKRNKKELLNNLIATTMGTVYIELTGPVYKIAPIEDKKLAMAAGKQFIKDWADYYLDIDKKYRENKYELMANFTKYKGYCGSFANMENWIDNMRQPHDILIVGYGVVGHNLAEQLKPLKPVIYDKYKNIDTRQFEEKYKIAFICVDTPRTVDNICDCSEILSAIGEHNADIYVIKSTILPGTTDKIIEQTGKHILFSPEYYGGTQHCNNFDFNFTILGGSKEDAIEVIQYLQKVYDGRHQFRIVDSKTAELAKYMENCWLATKVSFCNQFYNIAEDAGVNYEELRELFVLDPRVNESHTFVYRDKPYWQSHCLDKDINALNDMFDAPLLRDIIKFNESQK